MIIEATNMIGLMLSGAIAVHAKDVIDWLKTSISKLFFSELTIPDVSASYESTEEWLQHMAEKSVMNRRHELKSRYDRGTTEHLCLYPGKDWYLLKVQGKWLVVVITADRSNYAYTKPVIRIMGFSGAIKLARLVQQEIRQFKKNTSKPRVHLWLDGWRGRMSIPKRGLDTIFMDHQIKTDLINALNWFINNRAWYEDHEIPYKKGICLYGPPGTGKTSMIHAIANYLKMNLYYVTKPPGGDQELTRMMAEISPNSIIVLEDLDRWFSREKENCKVDTSTGVIQSGALGLNCILNCLDGTGAPENVVIVATTNHYDQIPPELMREGRMDIKLHMTVMGEAEKADMLRSFNLPADQIESFLSAKLTPAELQARIMLIQSCPEKVSHLLTTFKE